MPNSLQVVDEFHFPHETMYLLSCPRTQGVNVVHVMDDDTVIVYGESDIGRAVRLTEDFVHRCMAKVWVRPVSVQEQPDGAWIGSCINDYERYAL